METNPYSTPSADLINHTPAANDELARRFTRFCAALLDGIIMMCVIWPLQKISGVTERAEAEAQQAVANGEGYFGILLSNYMESLLWILVGVGVWIALNFTSLATGQTLGKRALKIKVVRKNGAPLERKRYILMRYFPVVGFSIVPIAGGFLSIIDALLIFREGKNTLHDDIADTKVIKL